MEDLSSNVTLAADITAAWLANPNNRVDAASVPEFLATIHAAIVKLNGSGVEAGEDNQAAAPAFVPATTVRKSLASRDAIISMIDGKPYRTLRRHLSTHGLTPDEYRARYNLRPDYPMVAPAYSEARRAMAKQIGLGRKPKAIATEAPATTATEAPATTTRRKLKVATPA